jgi:hypothetical protein
VFIVLLPSTERGADHTENTSQAIPTQRVHWRADCCLATSYNIRPIVACAYRGGFIDPLPDNVLTYHNITARDFIIIVIVVVVIIIFIIVIIIIIIKD